MEFYAVFTYFHQKNMFFEYFFSRFFFYKKNNWIVKNKFFTFNVKRNSGTCMKKMLHSTYTNQMLDKWTTELRIIDCYGAL